VNNTWNEERQLKEVGYFLPRISSLNLIITTLFDTTVERAYTEYNTRKIHLITGVDSSREDFDENLNEKDLTLYKILGTIDKPDTLSLSDDTMFDLRDKLMSCQKGVEFFRQIIRDKVIVLLGYDSRDRFDKFFAKVINDVSFDLDFPITNKMYFVNNLQYDTYYGLWRNTEKDNIIAIDMNIREFLERLNSTGF
jgi:hypothetical protein